MKRASGPLCGRAGVLRCDGAMWVKRKSPTLPISQLRNSSARRGV